MLDFKIVFMLGYPQNKILYEAKYPYRELPVKGDTVKLDRIYYVDGRRWNPEEHSVEIILQ